MVAMMLLKFYDVFEQLSDPYVLFTKFFSILYAWPFEFSLLL